MFQDLDNMFLLSGLSLFLGISGQHDAILVMADWAQDRWGVGGGSDSFIALSNDLNNAAYTVQSRLTLELFDIYPDNPAEDSFSFHNKNRRAQEG